MQIYADVTGRPMKISRSEQTPALGAAIFGAVSAGKNVSGFDNVEDAQEVMTGISKTYQPIEKNHETYKKLYDIYRQLHDGFGTKKWNLPDRQAGGNMYNVMKDLLDIRDEVKNG
jgi:L-ribulokinase